MNPEQIKELVAAVKILAQEKNLDEDQIHQIVEQAMAAAWRKDYGQRGNDANASLNLNDGSLKIWINKEVSEDVEDLAVQISLDDAKEFDKDAKVGEIVHIPVDIPGDFGRVAAQTAKQVILQKLRDAEREIVANEYKGRVGEVLIGSIQRIEPRIVKVDLGRAVGILPASEQIKGEFYTVGSRIKVLLKDVEEEGPRGPQIVLSRADPEFIKYLFAQEVPEMENGAVEIVKVARSAGARTKIAVKSSVPGVDPVGTFVGSHGVRVQAVTNEIGDQEKIDIIPYSEDDETYIINALSPTRVNSVKFEKDDQDNKRAKVAVNEDQLSVAIGRGGQNVRLASSLTGYEIDIEASTGAPSDDNHKNVDTKTNHRAKPKNAEDSLLSAIEENGAE
jgi:N utilization substance protein A